MSRVSDDSIALFQIFDFLKTKKRKQQKQYIPPVLVYAVRENIPNIPSNLPEIICTQGFSQNYLWLGIDTNTYKY